MASTSACGCATWSRTEPLGTGGRRAQRRRPRARAPSSCSTATSSPTPTSPPCAGFHETRGSRTTIFLTPVADPRAYGLVEIDADGRLLRFREKPTAGRADHDQHDQRRHLPHRRRRCSDRIPADRPVSIEREFFPALIADGDPVLRLDVGATYWRDIGSPAAYRDAQIDLLDGRARSPLPPAGRAARRLWIGAGGARGRRRPGGRRRRVLGAGVEVAARRSRRALAPCSATAAASATDARSRARSCGSAWRSGAGAVLRDCVVGADARIGADAPRRPGVVLESGADVPDARHALPLTDRGPAPLTRRGPVTRRARLNR